VSVSSQTVTNVVNTMLSHKKDFEIDELVKVTTFSKSTIRQAINIAQIQGSVIKIPGSYPAKFKVLERTPQLGETLIIKEVAPPPELNKEMMNQIRMLIAQDRFDDSLPNRIAQFYRTAEPAKRTQFRDFLINFAEVMKQDLTANKTLDLSDIQIGKK